MDKKDNRDQTLPTLKSQSLIAFGKFELRAKSYLQVFGSTSPTLRTLAEDSAQMIEDLLTLYIIDFDEFVNVGRHMKSSQVQWVARTILSDYGHLKPEDIYLFFDKAKKSDFGPLFDRLDGMILMGWMKQYYEERLNAAEADSIAQHQKNKGDQYDRSSQPRSIKSLLKPKP
jgi:hypothetical protein